MNKSLSRAVLLLLALGLALPAFARVPLYEREDNQRYRIKEGIYSGELTRGEARTLGKEQRNIKRLKKHLKRDGQFSKNEKRVLRKRYTKASRHIHGLKHNNHTRYSHSYSPSRYFYSYSSSPYAYSYSSSPYTYSYHPFSPWYYGGHGVLGFTFNFSN